MRKLDLDSRALSWTAPFHRSFKLIFFSFIFLFKILFYLYIFKTNIKVLCIHDSSILYSISFFNNIIWSVRVFFFSLNSYSIEMVAPLFKSKEIDKHILCTNIYVYRKVCTILMCLCTRSIHMLIFRVLKICMPHTHRWDADAINTYAC